MRLKEIILLLICLAFFSVGTEETFCQTQKDSVFSNPENNLKSKSPTQALFKSLAFPGWGQFYNEKYLKAGLVLGVETTYIILAVDQWRKATLHKKNFHNAVPYSPEQFYEFDLYKYHRDQRNLYLWITSGIVFLSMFDAYVDAHLYDFDKIEMKDLEVSLFPTDESSRRVGIFLSYRF